MIARLTGTVEKLGIGQLIMEVGGVGYLVTVPTNVWDDVQTDAPTTVWISTYVREDRLDLFGFLDRTTRTLFELLIAQSGIGPKTGLELCSIPRALMVQASHENDPKLLTSVKGVGKKTAEKLLVELRTLIEKQPEIFRTGSADEQHAHFDQDAISALASLGYDTATIMDALKRLPRDLRTTEARVAAALRTL